MALESSVTEQACERTHKGLDRQMETDTRRLNAHSADITDLKIIVSQLTQLLETTTKALETMEKRVSSLETAHEDTEKAAKIEKRVTSLETAQEGTEKANGFWQSSGGQWIIKGSVIIAVMITVAAIGQNVNPEFLASIFGK